MAHSRFSFTLSRYIGKKFTLITCATILALTGLISLFDFIDLLRRAAAHPETSLAIVLKIAALHIPYYVIYILPFGILLGGIICFSRLARSSELVVTRAAGISAWQALASPALCAGVMGLIVSLGFSSLSSYSYAKAIALDETWLRGHHSLEEINIQNVWLRENDDTLTPHGEAIFHIDLLDQRGGVLQASSITLFRLDHNMALLARIEAPKGELSHNVWQLHQAVLHSVSHPPLLIGELHLPSQITAQNLHFHSIPADTLSFWALPNMIKLLRHSGFSTIPYRLHFQGLLALPVLAVTMALVSAGFSMRPAGRGGIARMLSVGISMGFSLFAVSKIAEQLGKSGALPPLLASWAPAGAGLCLAAALLLHLEDG